MSSLGSEEFKPVAKTALGLPAKYATVTIDGKRMVDTLEESCTWGSTPDGGMSESSYAFHKLTSNH